MFFGCGFGQDTRLGWSKELFDRAREGDQGVEPGYAQREQDGDDRDNESTGEVGANHDPLAVEPIDDHTGDQADKQAGHSSREQHETDTHGGPGDAVDQERGGNPQHAVPDSRDELRGPQQGEVPPAEDRESRGQT